MGAGRIRWTGRIDGHSVLHADGVQVLGGLAGLGAGASRTE
jgi:hypothetical protein